MVLKITEFPHKMFQKSLLPRFCNLNGHLGRDRTYKEARNILLLPPTPLHPSTSPLHPPTSIYIPLRPSTSIYIPLYHPTSIYIIYSSFYIPSTYSYILLHPPTPIYIPLHPPTSIYIHLHPSTSDLHPPTSIYIPLRPRTSM